MQTEAVKTRTQSRATGVYITCPHDHAVLSADGDERLVCPQCTAQFPIVDGIARFVDAPKDEGQSQVLDAFGFKWSRDAWGYAPSHQEVMGRFFRDRFEFSDDAAVAAFFDGKTTLHAGVGNGQDEQHYLSHCAEVWGADISISVDACRKNWQENYPNLEQRFHLVQSDLMALPFADDTFDVVLSDGVLHHTPDTFSALSAITKKVKPGGHVMFYVYVKKAPIREFVDDYIRKEISALSPEQAWKALEPLTALAQELSANKHDISIPQDIDVLGLKAGAFDLQRWLYWNVMKFYWNDAMSFDENNHVNFDWYYPTYAWRQTPEEVAGWLDDLGLKSEVFNVTESGISVIARKPK